MEIKKMMIDKGKRFPGKVWEGRHAERWFQQIRLFRKERNMMLPRGILLLFYVLLAFS